MGRCRAIARGLCFLVCLLGSASPGCDGVGNPFDSGGVFDDSGSDPREEYNQRVREVIDAPKPAQSSEIRWGEDVECFPSFRAFKESAQRAGRKRDGDEWHHIVNQNPANKKRFGKRLHCTDNLIALPQDVHRRISSYYQSKDDWTGGKRVRDAIAGQSWREQYDFGLKQLRKHGIDP